MQGGQIISQDGRISHMVGFTLIEILIVLSLIGVVALPFSRLFLLGVKGTHDNTEHILSYNLAREKIEELKNIPFASIKSDFDSFRHIFRDSPGYGGAFDDKDKFDSVFSDIFTERCLVDAQVAVLFRSFSEEYRKVFRRNYKLYPEQMHGMRRVLDVDEFYDSAMPPRIKKIVVRVYNKSGRKTAELTTLVRRPR